MTTFEDIKRNDMGLLDKIFHKNRVSGNKPDMIQILKERARIIKSHDSNSYSACIEDLENLRTRAMSCGHFFEEAALLIDEIRYIMVSGENQPMYESAIARIQEIELVLDSDYITFSQSFEKIYFEGKNTMRQILVKGYLKAFYDVFFDHCEYMASNLQHHVAIICAKIMSKIIEISGGFSVEEQIENEFKIAVDYGYLSEVDKAILHYDKALVMAKACHDDTYTYIAICRKLSVCQGAANIDIRTNVDKHLRDAIKEMISFCESHGKTPIILGKALLSHEEAAYDSCGHKEKSMRKARIARLQEALPIMNLILALERGDAQTAEPYAEALSESEKKVYGGSSGSGSAIVSSLYDEHYSSPERDEAETSETDSENEEIEDGLLLGLTAEFFPADMPKAYILAYLQMMIRNEIMSDHPVNADHLYSLAKELATGLYSASYAASVDFQRGKSHHAKEEYDTAKHFYLKALELLHTSEPSAMVENMKVALSISLGSIYIDSKPEDAVRIMEYSMEALNINDVQYSRLKVSLHTGLAKAYDRLGDMERFEAHFIEGINELIAEASRRMPYLSKVNRETYWQEVQKSLWELLSMIDSDSPSAILTKAYESVLYAKGLLLSSEVALKKAIKEDIALEPIRSLYEETAEYEAHKRLWGTSTDDSADEYMNYFINSTKISIATEDVMRKHFNSLILGFSDITSSLDENDVVIDYYDYPISRDKQYIAFIYRKGDLSPTIVKVCRDSEIKAEYEKATEKSAGIYEYNGTCACDLGTILFGRIAEYCKISPDERIHFIPSGAIHKINIEVLPVCGETDERLYERYSKFIRLTHARNLISLEGDFELNDIQLYGGLEYDWDEEETSGGSRGFTRSQSMDTATPLLPWQYLPSSKIEVNDIADIWNANKNTTAKINTGKDGSTEHFFSMDGDAPSIIHLATHGFFETKQSVERLPALRGLHQPMDLTGIVMSCGNEGWILGNPGCHKGIIRASDISSMNLDRTKMVVLSACHSAEGVIHADGVFGLQRAFKKAGAGCIIMSLWEVSDEAGTFFMRVFYHELLSKRQNRHTAFRNAQKETRCKYPDPLYWAGYIMID